MFKFEIGLEAVYGVEGLVLILFQCSQLSQKNPCWLHPWLVAGCILGS